MTLEQAAQEGRKGSLMFGSPPKSGSAELEAGSQPSQGQAQEAAPVAPAAVNIHPAIAEVAGPKAAEQTKAQLAKAVSKAQQPVQGTMLDLYDAGLLERPIGTEEEAQAYLEETWLPYVKLTEEQRFTRSYCLALLLEGRIARQSAARAILAWDSPNAQARTEQPNAGTRAADMQLAAEAGQGYWDFLAKREVDLMDAAERGVPFDPIEDTDEGLNDGLLEDDSPKAKAASYSGQEPADKYTGPVTPTGMRLLPEVVRPIVVTFLRTKDIGKQGDIERQLGLDITNSHADVKSVLAALKRSEETQEGRFNAVADAATTALINEGTRLWKAKQGESKAETPAPAPTSGVEEQMALLQQTCQNKAVGCTGKRHSHRNAKAQCFDQRCPCKGRCEQFVPPSGGGESKSGPESGGVAGVAVDGGPAAGGAPVSSAAAIGGGALALPLAARSESEEQYIRRRMTEIRCVRPTDEGRPCGMNADVHRLYTGNLFIGGNQGGHVACKGFMPSPEKQEEFAGLVARAKELGIAIGDWKGGDADAGPKSDGGGLGQGAGQNSGADSGANTGANAGVGSGAGSTGPSEVPAVPAGGAGATAVVPLAGRVEQAPARLGGAFADSGPQNSVGVVRAGDSGPGSGVAVALPTPTQPGPTTGTDGEGTAQGPEGHDAGVHVGEGAGPEEAPTTPALTQDEITRELTWLGGFALDGTYFPPDGAADDPNWWPVTEPFMDEKSVARRSAMVARILEWWRKAIHTTLKQGPDDPGTVVLNGAFNLRSTSYRKVLAAKELSAQLERYATAHNLQSPPPEEELVGAVNRAAVNYLEAHKPATEPDTDFATYMEACEVYGIEVGTSWADIQKRLPKPEDDEPPF